MTTLKEVPTDELLSFQDYPIAHSTSPANPQVNIDFTQQSLKHTDYSLEKPTSADSELNTEPDGAKSIKSFWTLEYYQKFFDVDTKDVTERIIASINPKQDNLLKTQMKERPDLYGPFWISVTLVFTIAISGNIANYLHHGNNVQYHWKYDFHLVSYAATTICIYISLVPLAVWGLIKWSTEIADLDGLEDITTPKALELICIYGYSLFIYIPVSILWTIQISWLQWLLALMAAFLSGSVLLSTLMPVLKLSKHKLLIIVAISTCHLLLAAGFMLFFFHNPNTSDNVPKPVIPIIPLNGTIQK